MEWVCFKLGWGFSLILQSSQESMRTSPKENTKGAKGLRSPPGVADISIRIFFSF